jgi:hypothetical protein
MSAAAALRLFLPARRLEPRAARLPPDTPSRSGSSQGSADEAGHVYHMRPAHRARPDRRGAPGRGVSCARTT